MFAGKKSAQIREILISESAWEEMTCLFAPSLTIGIDFGGAVIFVGANGSGKSRLAINIEESLGEQAHRISAHRALNLNPDVPKIREDKALRTLRYGDDWEGISIGNRNRSRWRSKASSFLLNDFDSVIQALFAEQSKEGANKSLI